eukprot:4033427-Prymnesium_polylepis.1
MRPLLNCREYLSKNFRLCASAKMASIVASRWIGSRCNRPCEQQRFPPCHFVLKRLRILVGFASAGKRKAPQCVHTKRSTQLQPTAAHFRQLPSTPT